MPQVMTSALSFVQMCLLRQLPALSIQHLADQIAEEEGRAWSFHNSVCQNQYCKLLRVLHYTDDHSVTVALSAFTAVATEAAVL